MTKEEIKLRVIVSKPCPFAGIDVSDHEEEIKKAISEGHTVVSISYLDGKVESEMGYDIGVCLNGEECVSENLYKEGEYDVEVVGYPNTCKAFLWNSGDRPRGLIVDPLELEDLKRAQEKFRRHENYI